MAELFSTSNVGRAIAARFESVEASVAAIGQGSNRGINNLVVVDGFLIVTYSDGTSQNAGFIGGGSGEAPTIDNTLGMSALPGAAVSGFITQADDIDARLTALGF